MKVFSYSKFLVYGIFTTELMIFIGVYFFSGHGIYAVHNLARENETLSNEIHSLEDMIQKISYHIDMLQKKSFYKEKIAREQLHMARVGNTTRTDDEIYYVATTNTSRTERFDQKGI